MAGTLRTWVRDYVRTHRSHPTPPNFTPPVTPGPDRSPEQELGQRLASESQALQRRVAVQPNTIVLLMADDGVQIKRPGVVLQPNLLSVRRPSYVVVVSTAVTRLDVTMHDLPVRDENQNIPLVRIRVSVQVSDGDDYAALVGAAQVHHTDLDGYLTECVKRELDEKVRRAVKWNELAFLQERTLEAILAEDGIPSDFAAGVLVQRGFEVLQTIWPASGREQPQDRASAGSAFGRPQDGSADLPRPSELDLTMDAGLRRVWRNHAELELLGIAGAQVSGGSTVIAVPAREPEVAEANKLREAFGHHFKDRRVRLVSAVAGTYDDVVRAWFRQVDSWPRRLVSVTGSEDDEALEIHVDQHRLPPEERTEGPRVGQESDREALRRLLPHHQVEFVSADTS